MKDDPKDGMEQTSPANPIQGEIDERIKKIEADLVVALSNLERFVSAGNIEAARMIVDLGVRCAVILRNGIESSGKHGRTIQDVAKVALEWPVICPAFVDRRAANIEGQIPPILGENLDVRTGSTKGKGGQRDLHPDARAGTAWAYMQDLEIGRQLAREYPTASAAKLGQYVKQGNDAMRIAGHPDFLKSMTGPLLQNIDIESIGELLKVGSDGPEIDLSKVKAMAEKLLDSPSKETPSFDAAVNEAVEVIPDGISEIWNQVKELNDFNEQSIQEWINASLALAKVRHAGKLSMASINEKIVGGYPQLLRERDGK